MPPARARDAAAIVQTLCAACVCDVAHPRFVSRSCVPWQLCLAASLNRGEPRVRRRCVARGGLNPYAYSLGFRTYCCSCAGNLQHSRGFRTAATDLESFCVCLAVQSWPSSLRLDNTNLVPFTACLLLRSSTWPGSCLQHDLGGFLRLDCLCIV